MDRIVVGIDGSMNSVRALRWALGESKAHHATIEAVICWSYPMMPADGFSGMAAMIDPSAFQEAASQTLEAAIAKACPETEANTAIKRSIVEGSAGQTLIEASRDADLLVVGSRGHGGFAGLLLGSVSTQCVHHARCPITVVPPDTQD